jgi:hypothetical protein
VLILRRSEKIAHGTLAQIREQHGEQGKLMTLEEIFIHLLGDDAQSAEKA